MKKSVKEAWVEALRSGEYKQGEGYLCQMGIDGAIRHCCLGVLTDMGMKKQIPVEEGVSITQDEHYKYVISIADRQFVYYEMPPETELLQDRYFWVKTLQVKDIRRFIERDPKRYQGLTRSLEIQGVEEGHSSPYTDVQIDLTLLNDRGIPFEVIADVIENFW